MKRKFSVPELIISTIVLIVVLYFSMPTLVDMYEKQQYATGLKKAYGQFNQALEKISDDSGCNGDLKCTGLFADGTTDETFGDKLVKYFKVKKNCGTTPDEGCFAPYTNENYDGASSKVYQLDEWTGYRFITKDGMSFYVWNYADGCVRYRSYSGNGNLTQACGEIYVDVNGPELGPNLMGRDTFNLWISNGKGALLYPMGGSDTKWSDEDWRWKDSNGVVQHCYPGDKIGWPCAGRIMEQGWQMKY